MKFKWIKEVFSPSPCEWQKILHKSEIHEKEMFRLFIRFALSSAAFQSSVDKFFRTNNICKTLSQQLPFSCAFNNIIASLSRSAYHCKAMADIAFKHPINLSFSFQFMRELNAESNSNKFVVAFVRITLTDTITNAMLGIMYCIAE